ncbi:hypothetical protein [Saccharopolyspora spinosa]|uniref:hypothetical protein n=1 Tax=Saccharopolyspora spinosa TaxID=60894 RepID=UPI003BA8F206
MALVVVATAGPPGPGLAVTGFRLLNLAMNPAKVLTYDLIISSAPPERAGTASGSAETGDELGIAVGVAIAGSIGAAVYRAQLAGDAIPAATPTAVAETARDTLASAVAAADELPAHGAAQLLAVVKAPHEPQEHHGGNCHEQRRQQHG